MNNLVEKILTDATCRDAARITHIARESSEFTPWES